MQFLRILLLLLTILSCKTGSTMKDQESSIKRSTQTAFPTLADCEASVRKISLYGTIDCALAVRAAPLMTRFAQTFPLNGKKLYFSNELIRGYYAGDAFFAFTFETGVISEDFTIRATRDWTYERKSGERISGVLWLTLPNDIILNKETTTFLMREAIVNNQSAYIVSGLIYNDQVIDYGHGDWSKSFHVASHINDVYRILNTDALPFNGINIPPAMLIDDRSQPLSLSSSKKCLCLRESRCLSMNSDGNCAHSIFEKTFHLDRTNPFEKLGTNIRSLGECRAMANSNSQACI
jgi:hypothetical protein